MKLIDEKGKLFGLINLLDLFVAIFVIVICGFIASRLISNPESYAVGTDDSIKDMYVTVKCAGVTDEFINSIEVGDKLLAQNAYTGGEVYAISEPVPYEYTGVDDQGNVVISYHPYLKDVYVTLHTEQNIDNPIIKINGQEARVGTKIFFKTQKVESSAMVTDISFDEPPTNVYDNPDNMPTK